MTILIPYGNNPFLSPEITSTSKQNLNILVSGKSGPYPQNPFIVDVQQKDESGNFSSVYLITEEKPSIVFYGKGTLRFYRLKGYVQVQAEVVDVSE